MRRTTSTRLIALMVGLTSVSLVAQSEPTLRQMAIEHGGIGRVIQGCGPAPSLAGIVQRADLIVEGVVIKRVSYLTPDDDDVYTDYELAIGQTILQQQMLTSPRPGMVPSMVFKSHGGRVMTDGLDITVDIQANNSRLNIQTGDHVVVFGRRDAKDGKWLLGPYDVFRVLDTNVVAPDTFSDVATYVPREQFLHKIHQLQMVAGLPF
jgi:hypothetical protein